MMRTLVTMLVGLLLLYLTPGGLCQGCAVNEAEHPLVRDLQKKMIYSVDASAPPNPSILLSLRLAQDHNMRIEQDMLNKLSQDAVQRAVVSFSSGQVALHILAQQASCSDPRRVSANSSTINLVHLLEQKFQAELQNIAIHGNPLTNFYQLSLDVLVLCQLNGRLSPANASALLSPDHKKYYLGGQFSVDTAAVAVLAQICLQTRGQPLPPKVHKKIRQNVQWLVDKILAKKRRDGVIGNIYSTGLAMQALSVSSSYLKPGAWNCLQTLHRVLDEIPQGTFKNPMAASQILPSLENRTYLDVSRLNCSMNPDNLPLSTARPAPPTSCPPSISVTYTVADSLNNTFNNSISVTVPQGSVFFKVMEVAQDKDPSKFSFTYTQSSWGPYITSVQGLQADNNQHTYWQLLSNGIPLSQGAGDYVVSNSERLEVKFSVY
ncbi:transcobalamin-1-like [Trachemys scripta elegans]|uniref:transcobalamin-1-like n=1 Tax=Trachemys scripta elegans TaxID=31138 RepID=UPI0015516CED|nr:transcobalamin-1-like [Trachemys scripta elegans]